MFASAEVISVKTAHTRRDGDTVITLIESNCDIYNRDTFVNLSDVTLVWFWEAAWLRPFFVEDIKEKNYFFLMALRHINCLWLTPLHNTGSSREHRILRRWDAFNGHRNIMMCNENEGKTSSFWKPIFVLQDVGHQNNSLTGLAFSLGFSRGVCASQHSFTFIVWKCHLEPVAATATSQKNMSQILFGKYVSDVISGSGLNLSAKHV